MRERALSTTFCGFSKGKNGKVAKPTNKTTLILIMLNTCVRYLLNKINSHLSGKLLNAMLVLLLCQPTLQVHKPSIERQRIKHQMLSHARKHDVLRETTSRSLRQHFSALPCTALLPGTESQCYPSEGGRGRLMWRELTCWAHYRSRNRFPRILAYIQPTKQCFACTWVQQF